MQADVVHGADFAVHVGDADGLIAAGEFFGFVEGGECGLSSELYVVTHEACVMSAKPLPSFARLGRARAPVPTRTRTSYFGCIVCATITWRLKFSIMCSSSRTSVGRLASVMVSILSCSLSNAYNKFSGRGGHPITYTSTGTMRSTPCSTA